MRYNVITAWIMVVILSLCGVVLPANAETAFSETIRQAPPEITSLPGRFGKYIIFGSYEQDNDLENGPEPIEWRVLEVKDGKALVVSLYALELMQYHGIIAADESVTWETWDIRAWLNGEFMEAAFTAAEKLRIPDVTVRAQWHRYSNATLGNHTQDHIFLLSLTEIEEYWPQKGSRKCSPTAYAIANYEIRNGEEWPDTEVGYKAGDKGNCNWWVRTPGEFDGSASWINRNGTIAFLNYQNLLQLDTRNFDYGIRPAMWIDLEP
ncbi:MAG: hypothetical protein E7335_07115 [Clostridiales bacterium]|nr:hypothetical protein [Clostridiales bacterium]